MLTTCAVFQTASPCYGCSSCENSPVCQERSLSFPRVSNRWSWRKPWRSCGWHRIRKKTENSRTFITALLTVQLSVCKHANTHITNRSAHSEMLLPHSRSAWADIEYQLGWSSQYAKITFDQSSMPTSVQMTKTQSAQCTQPQIPINLKD